MCRLLAAFVFIVTVAAPPAGADTTFDCGRFYLKYNPATEKMECVGGKKAKRNAGPSIQTLTRQLQISVTGLQQTLSGAEGILRENELSTEQHTRVGALLTEARQRVEEIRRRTAELVQAEKTRKQELLTEQRQIVEAQVQLAHELEQKQIALTQQLMAEVRSRSQEIKRR